MQTTVHIHNISLGINPSSLSNLGGARRQVPGEEGRWNIVVQRRALTTMIDWAMLLDGDCRRVLRKVKDMDTSHSMTVLETKKVSADRIN